MRSQHRRFQAATLDFVDLMNDGWQAAITCCKGVQQVTADGIQIVPKLSQSCTQHPYEAPENAPLIAGVQQCNGYLVEESDIEARPIVFTVSYHQACECLVDTTWC
jgi:hypothetical protein